MEQLENKLQALKLGDINALDYIYKKTSNLVFSIAFSYTKDRSLSEDIMLETYINIRKYINSYKENTNPVAWISTLAKNLSLYKLKQDKNVTYVENFYDNEQFEREEVNHHHDKSTLILDVAKEILKQKELFIVLSHILDDKTFKEIALDTKGNENSVRWAYNNALNKIRKVISERGLI